MINSGVALFIISDHDEWWDKPFWTTLVVGLGLLVLVAGFRLDVIERARRRLGA